MESRAITETPPARPTAEPSGGSRAAHSWWRDLLSSPLVIWSVVCLALAALSAAILPTVPSYDPWSWIVWGRELVNPHLGFSTGGGPSWKPFPVIFTTVYGLFGGASPTLWVITARAGGLMSLVAAYRLASRMTPGETWMRAVAGALAAIGVALTQEWAYYMYRGTSEPMLVGLSLWAVDRHLAGKRGAAFLLGVAAALIRPEAWPFIAIYGVWLFVREPRLRFLVLLGWLSIPVLWFVPPWISSGDPLLASVHAKDYNGHLGKHPFFEVLRRGADLQVLPALVFAILGTAIAWFRDRDKLTVGMAAAAAGWWVLVVAMTIDGYPGLERFYLPAAGLICVLAGMGVVRVGQLIGSWLQGRGMAASSVAWATAGDRRRARADLDPADHQPDLGGPCPERDHLARGDPAEPAVRRRRRGRRPRRRLPLQGQLLGGQPRRADGAGLEAAGQPHQGGDLDAPLRRDVRRAAGLDRRQPAQDRSPDHRHQADRARGGLEGLPGHGPQPHLLRRRLSGPARGGAGG